ncbi:hypothetical protein [Sphingomonas morindae]|uniref:Uncharacterized protein n=1 Tax=Sphingomonas morindae TaxID=1541170 RepID=A0ABY4X832_9SPHN|nr:hypothetical protein [Sphingomonas morindae]USI73092.1 hypothetical protein LHA26_01015 [Sphingomonas morindae]
MTAPAEIVTLALCGLIGLAMLIAGGLAGWRGWLDLQHAALGHGPAEPAARPSPAGARIELADLKERVRKLEAIAAGIDL